MKKLLIFAIVLLAAGGLYYYFNSSPAKAPVSDNQSATNGSFHPDPSSATFIFDGESVTLSEGKSQSEDAGGLSSETTLLEERAYGDLNGDDKNDSVVLVARSGGGSGVFIYAAAFVSGAVRYKGTDAIYIGDRISPKSLSIKNGVATLSYLDRGPDEAFASEPTVPATKLFIFKNGTFQER